MDSSYIPTGITGAVGESNEKVYTYVHVQSRILVKLEKFYHANYIFFKVFQRLVRSYIVFCQNTTDDLAKR